MSPPTPKGRGRRGELSINVSTTQPVVLGPPLGPVLASDSNSNWNSHTHTHTYSKTNPDETITEVINPREWLAGSNPPSPLDSPGLAGFGSTTVSMTSGRDVLIPTTTTTTTTRNPKDSSGYFNHAPSSLPHAQGREILPPSLPVILTRIKKQRSGWNLRSNSGAGAALGAHHGTSTTTTSTTNSISNPTSTSTPNPNANSNPQPNPQPNPAETKRGMAGLVQRLRTRSRPDLKAAGREKGKVNGKGDAPPLPGRDGDEPLPSLRPRNGEVLVRKSVAIGSEGSEGMGVGVDRAVVKGGEDKAGEAVKTRRGSLDSIDTFRTCEDQDQDRNRDRTRDREREQREGSVTTFNSISGSTFISVSTPGRTGVYSHPHSYSYSQSMNSSSPYSSRVHTPALVTPMSEVPGFGGVGSGGMHAWSGTGTGAGNGIRMGTGMEPELDPFDLNSPTTEIYNFSEFGFLGGQAQVGVLAGPGAGVPAGDKAEGYFRNQGRKGQGTSRAGSPAVGLGQGTGEARPKLTSARSLKDLRTVAEGIFGEGPALSQGTGVGGTLRGKKSCGRLQKDKEVQGRESRVIGKRTSLSWLRDTLGRKQTLNSPKSREVLREEQAGIRECDSFASGLSLGSRQDEQRKRVRPALTITLPSSASLGQARPAIPLTLPRDESEEDFHSTLHPGQMSGKRDSAWRDGRGEALPKPNTSASFTDLYAELGMSPPGEGDAATLPYSPRIVKGVEEVSFAQLGVGLEGDGPIVQPIDNGCPATPGKEKNRASWRSSRHSLKPASAPPTASLPPLPVLTRRNTGVTASNSLDRVIDRPVVADWNSARSSTMKLPILQFAKNWEDSRETGQQAVGSETEDDTANFQIQDWDKSMDLDMLLISYQDTFLEEMMDETRKVGVDMVSPVTRSCSAGNENKETHRATREEQTTASGQGYTSEQLGFRGRMITEDKGKGGPSRSRSRSPPRAPIRLGSPVSEADTESSSESDRESSDNEADSDDDDVPLAKRIPGALQAQKTLRRETRRAKRASRHPAAPSAQIPKKRQVRVDGRDNPNWQGEGGVPAKDLENKLQQLAAKLARADVAGLAGPALRSPISHSSGFGNIPPPPAPTHQTQSRQPGSYSDLSRHTSVKRANTRTYGRATADNSPVLGSGGFATNNRQDQAGAIPPMPKLHHLASSSSIRQYTVADSSSKEWLASRTNSISRANRAGPSPNTTAADLSAPSGKTSGIPSRKPSIAPLADERPSSRQASNPQHPAPIVEGQSRMITRTGTISRSRQASGDKAPIAVIADPVISRQRIYLESLQGECQVIELKASTTANDVLKQVVKDQGSNSMMGNWTLFEIFGEFYGAERPVRVFESLVTIMKGWNPEARLNAFLVKRSPLDRLTRPEMIPRVMPMHGVYVQHEAKKGKWNKRWVELRNGSIFIAKNDRGKDNEFLCSSSAFDAYVLNGNGYKGPKPFVIILKSREAATLFESSDDYLHVFSLDSAPGTQLMEILYTAKSCAMLPELQAAPSIPSYSTHAPTAPLVHVPQQALVDIKPSSVFTGGSLLSRLAGKR